MSKNLDATQDKRMPALLLGLAAFLLALAGAVPTYGVVGAIAGFVLGILAWRQAKGAGSMVGTTFAVLAIYLGIIRFLLTLLALFVFPDLISSEPRHVITPKPIAGPVKLGNVAKPNP